MLFPNLSKPNDTGSFDWWKSIIDPNLNQTVDFAKQILINASSRSNCENLFAQIEVVHLRLNKHTGPSEHEFILLDTKDIKDGTERLFALDRQFKVRNRPIDNKTVTHKSEPLPSCSASTLSSMEEGTLETVSLHDHHHSVIDAMSMSATKMAQTLSNSKNKGNTPVDGLDKFVGENFILGTGYASGKSGRQIKPTNLSLLEFLILAQAVHEFAPEYTFLERNCYWYCNMVFDACIELFPLHDYNWHEDDKRNAKFSPHDTAVSGRIWGMKVSCTKAEELSAVVLENKKAHRGAFKTVEFIFSKVLFHANSEQILDAHDTHDKAMFVDWFETLRIGQNLILWKNCAKLVEHEGKYKLE